jgi:hypothetical protein
MLTWTESATLFSTRHKSDQNDARGLAAIFRFGSLTNIRDDQEPTCSKINLLVEPAVALREHLEHSAPVGDSGTNDEQLHRL